VTEKLEKEIADLTARKEELEPRLETATKRRAELETQLKPTKQLFGSESKRLKSLNKAEVKLETARKDALLIGGLEKKAKTEESLEKLRSERERVVSELGRIQSKEILGTLAKREEKARNAETAHKGLLSNDQVKHVRNVIKQLEKEIKSPSKERVERVRKEWEGLPPEEQAKTTVAGMAHREISKEIANMKKQHPFALKAVEDMGKTYKEIKRNLEKAQKEIADLELDRIKAIGKADKKKWEKVEKQIIEQRKIREKAISDLGELPKKIEELEKNIAEEKRRVG